MNRVKRVSRASERLVVKVCICGCLFLFVGGAHYASASVPSITGLSVSVAAVGDLVTITGTNFGSTQGTSSVTINGAQVGTYTSWGNLAIKVKVPNGASTTGNVVVTVPGAGSSNGWPFTVVPSITSLSLTSGPAQMGFDINGNTFGSAQGTSTVKIGATNLIVMQNGWNSTLIRVQVPAGAATGSVVVTVAGNASNAKTFTIATYGCP